MTLYIEPKENCSIQDANFYKNTKYRAVVVDYWKDADNDKSILGLRVTGGHYRIKIVAITQGELFDKFNVKKEDEE